MRQEPAPARRALRAALPLLLALAACGAPPEAPAGEQVSALTRSPTTTAVPWSVFIQFPDQSVCTASVLTQRWLLTAAHCLTGRPSATTVQVSFAQAAGSSTLVYAGSATLRPHPDEDIGLLFLSNGTGLGGNVALTGRANVFVDPAEPWCTPGLSRGFLIAGWGWGTPQGGSDSCDGGTIGVKRLGAGFVVDTGQCGDISLSAEEQHGVHTCGGDSGSPWFLQGPTRPLAFAVHEGRFWVPFDHYHRGTKISPFLSWFRSTSLSVNRAFTLQTSPGIDGTMDFVTFSEVNVPPPPPPACPAGQRCCEPRPGGGCQLCVSTRISCP